MAKVKKSINSKINSKSSLRIVWKDLWENYSKQKENEIIKYYKNKHKVDRVTVDFVATNSIKLGAVNLETNEIENINSPEVQEKIIVEWLKENRIDVEIGDIKRLNKRVEAKLNELNVKDNRWTVKSLELENFLSYGEKTTFDFEKLKGITVVNGRNFAGKTTFMNALVWLLFGNIDKAKTVDEVINRYNGATSATVSGILVIEGQEIKIERTVERHFKKKTGEYQKTSSTLKFMKLQPDGTYREDDKEEDRNATEKTIRENIGTLNEFLMTIVCTGDNIFDIIKAKATERGQTLSRFLGLEIFERKLEVVKTLFSEWKIKANLNKYTTVELSEDIKNNADLIGNYDTLITEKNVDFNNYIKLKGETEQLIEVKQAQLFTDIDATLVNKTEADFQSEINTIIEKININKIEINRLNESIKTDLELFNESAYNQNISLIGQEEQQIRNIRLNISQNIQSKVLSLESSIRTLELENSRQEGEIATLKQTIKALREGDKCPECGQKLEDVDHTDVINQKIEEGKSKRALINGNDEKIITLKTEIETLKAEIVNEENKIPSHEENIKVLRSKNEELNKNQLLIKENDILILTRDKCEVENERLEMNKGLVQTKLERYIADKEKIVANNVIKIEINDLKIKVTQCDEQIRMLQRIIVENTTNKNNLLKRNEELEELILQIKKEEHISKIFEIYIMMVGKNGISKSVMRKSIPLLNLELSKFLKDSALFTVEIEINEKNNEVEFWKVDNENGHKSSLATGSGYEKTIASLAIRIVNSKINTLPKPSLLLIDEIFSTVDNENLELVKMFLDKVITTIDNLFIITHNEMVKEWADHIVNVTKENNVSKISI